MQPDIARTLNQWNFEPRARDGLTPPAQVTVVDCTLREGEQTPGAVFQREDKIRLAAAMVEAGFTELEVGMPAISPYEAETIAMISKSVDCLCYGVCMATRDDVMRAKACGLDGIGLSLPAGRLQLEAKLGWSHDRVIATAVELTSLAYEQGLKVTLSPYDTYRADPDFLKEYLQTVRRHGRMDRVRVVDTVGCAAPHAVAWLVHRMREWTDDQVPIEVHCHNDFGLAVANTIAGVMAGADVVSTTLNGLGERAGGASTQQVIAALELMYGIRTGIKLTSLTPLSRLVEEISGISVQLYEPIVGPLTYQMESGSIVSGYLKDPLVAFPFGPELVGGKVTVVLGKKSGRHSVQYKLVELGFSDLPADAVGRLTERVKSYAEATGATVKDQTFAGWAAEEAAAGADVN